MTLGPIPGAMLVYRRLILSSKVLTFVEASVAFLLDDATQGLRHALLLVVLASDMHLTLDSDVGVRDRGCEEFSQGAEEEGDGGCHLSPLLDVVLHLLEEGVLEDGVDDEDQGRDDAGEEGLGTLVPEQGHEGAHGGGGPCPRPKARLDVGLCVLLARGDPGVDDPDGVGDDDGGGAGKGSGHHGLDGSELLAGAAGRLGGRFEKGARPLVPVVVDEVCDADAEEGRVDARVQAGDALAGNDSLNGGDEARVGLFGLDLGARGQRDEGIAGMPGGGELATSFPLRGVGKDKTRTRRARSHPTYVRAMDRMPPPAPARAWATFSF